MYTKPSNIQRPNRANTEDVSGSPPNIVSICDFPYIISLISVPYIFPSLNQVQESPSNSI